MQKNEPDLHTVLFLEIISETDFINPFYQWRKLVLILIFFKDNFMSFIIAKNALLRSICDDVDGCCEMQSELRDPISFY